jgi:hypothetical protein
MIPGGRKQKSPNRWNLAELEIRGFAGDQKQSLDTGP